MACTHVDSKYLPNPYNFPATFYAEQNLTIRALRNEKKTLKAQVQKKADVITLVFLDPEISMVLLKLELKKDLEPKFLYQTPVLEKSGFAAMKIARAIQFLYESRDIPLRNSEYRVKGPANAFTYVWERLTGSGDCQFPEDMELKFDDEKYKVEIGTATIDCSI